MMFGYNHGNDKNKNVSFEEFNNISSPYGYNIQPDYYGYNNHNNQNHQYPNIFLAGKAPPHPPTNQFSNLQSSPMSKNVNTNIANFSLNDSPSNPVHTSAK
jgi:hypothetical protein